MGFLDKLNNFATKCEELSSKLEEKTAKMAENAKNYVEEERVANYWINRPPFLVRTVPVIPVPNVPPKLKKDSRLAE